MVWMNQNQIAELFDTSKQNIGQHVSKILLEGELKEEAVVNNYFTTVFVNRKTGHKNNVNMVSFSGRNRSVKQKVLFLQVFLGLLFKRSGSEIPEDCSYLSGIHNLVPLNGQFHPEPWSDWSGIEDKWCVTIT
jgi:hypothetical protein